jgi:hypothetical protein
MMEQPEVELFFLNVCSISELVGEERSLDDSFAIAIDMIITMTRKASRRALRMWKCSSGRRTESK